MALILALAANVFAQNSQPFDFSAYGVKIEPDKRLIVVLASLEAAGFETPLSEKGSDFRRRLRADLATLDPELVGKMQYFVKQFRSRHAGDSEAELVAPFISMAYTLTPVPDLSEPLRTTDLPGDLLEVLDYSPLVRQFYRSVLRTPDGNLTVGQRIDQYYKEYQEAGDRMRPSHEV